MKQVNRFLKIWLAAMMATFAVVSASGQNTVGPFTYYPTNLGGTMYGQAQINGVNAVQGDIIAAFDPSGECVGAKLLTINGGKAYINFVLYGDDGGGHGMNSGELFYLKIYDASANQIIEYGQGFAGWQNTQFTPMPGYNNSNTIYNFVAVTYSLAVSPANQNVTCSAGNTTFNLTSNTSWTVSDDATWLTVTPASGSNNATLTATYEANSTGAQRIGTITVSGTGVPSVTVTVTQAPCLTLAVTPANQNVTCSAGNTTFNLTSNTSWTTSDNAAWLTVAPASGSNNATLTATYEANSTGAQRVGTITITGTGVPVVTVTITQAPCLTLAVTPANQNVSCSAGNTTFGLTSNTSWTVSDNATWLTVAPASGSNNATLTATYEANSTGAQRVGSITITGTGVPVVTVTVTQAPCLTLAVTPANQNVSYSAGSTTFTLTSNTSWNVTDDATWLTVTPANGNNNGTLTATYEGNSTGVQRVGTITVSGTGVPSVTVTVTQAANLTILATPANQNVTYAAGSTTITITSNTSWTVTDDATWLTVTPASGSNNGTLTATYEANSTGVQRVGTITVSGTGVPLVTVTVTQAGEVWFNPVWQTPFQSMSIFISKATIDDLDMVSGDEIGVFDVDPDSGDEICVGAGVLIQPLTGGAFLEIIASMDDGLGATNGFQSGNEMIFKLYTPAEGEVDLVIVTFPYPGYGYDEVFAPLGTAVVELDGTTRITQNIGMIEGWNLVSFRVLPDNLNMLNIFNPLIESSQLIKVLDQDGKTIVHLPFPPPNGQWSNTIGNLTIEQGYYVNLNSIATLSITAPPVEMPFEIPLRAGWNIIGMPCGGGQPAQQLLQTLISDGKLVKVINDAGQSIVHLPFPPPNGQWSYGFTSFLPDEGYYVKVSETASLTFDCEVADGSMTTEVLPAIKPATFVPAYQNNPFMPMTIALSLDTDFETGNEIGIFDGETCVGSTVVGNENIVTIPVSMDNPETEAIDGFMEGNVISAKMWNHLFNTIEEIELQYIEGAGYFQALETYAGKANGLFTGVQDGLNMGEVYVEINPNPVKGKAQIKYTLPSDGQVNIALYHIDGRQIRNLLDSKQQTGEGSLEFYSDELQPGYYMVNFTFDGVIKTTFVKKLMIY